MKYSLYLSQLNSSFVCLLLLGRCRFTVTAFLSQQQERGVYPSRRQWTKNCNSFFPASFSTLTQFQATKKGSGGNSNSGTTHKGFGTTSKTNQKPSKKAVLKRIEKIYGGTSGPQIVQATQQRIEKAMRQLPPHLQIATRLYQQLQTWDARLNSMTVLQQTTEISSAEMEGAQRAREELHRIYDEHNITEIDLRNVFQRTTWDASADAKAARSITGEMPTPIAERIDRACAMVAEAVGNDGRCLDVGCGFGVLVPYLTRPPGRRLKPCQIYGIDLSPEMIRNAQELHGTTSTSGPTFEAVDFLRDYHPPLDKDGNGTFEAVMFCSALHDMPDMDATLAKAWSLVKPGGGRLFILHAQGASHVARKCVCVVVVAAAVVVANQRG